jgi:hypothetical protein
MYLYDIKIDVSVGNASRSVFSHIITLMSTLNAVISVR